MLFVPGRMKSRVGLSNVSKLPIEITCRKHVANEARTRLVWIASSGATKGGLGGARAPPSLKNGCPLIPPDLMNFFLGGGLGFLTATGTIDVLWYDRMTFTDLYFTYL